jgi:hypothetical protein
MQVHGAGLAMALLGDDEFGLVPDLGDLFAPGRVFLDVVDWRLALLIFAAVDKHYDVGVLLDRAGLAQIG